MLFNICYLIIINNIIINLLQKGYIFQHIHSIKPQNPQNKNHFIIVIFACYFYSDCRKNNLPLQKVEAKPE